MSGYLCRTSKAGGRCTALPKGQFITKKLARTRRLTPQDARGLHGRRITHQSLKAKDGKDKPISLCTRHALDIIFLSVCAIGVH